MIFLSAINDFFFRRIPAQAFGMMRIAWASVAGLYFLFQFPYVSYYYSEAGILPLYLEPQYERTNWLFTLLNYVTEPLAVQCLFLIMLICLLCTTLGIRTRAALMASVVLMFSFHERNTAVLSGGDTMLRLIGFLMIFTPGINALSLDRARKGWDLWKKKKELLPPVMMPIWAWRVLLWQMIVIYVTSFWTKMLGAMWRDGTAIQITLHNPQFSRLPYWFLDHFLPMSPLFDYATLAWQASWLLLLVPVMITDMFPRFIPRIPLRRILLIIGIPFHLAIFLMMDAGVFSLAMFVAYIGLLREDDGMWLKKVMSHESRVMRNNRDSGLKTSSPIVVLFDGQCGLCMRSMYSLMLCDWLHVLKPVNFRILDDRNTFAPGITENKLDKAMHIRLPDGSYLTGFDAFRYITKMLPPLWLAYPLLWIPGVDIIGRKVYSRIADSRKKCDHEHCTI